MTEQQGIILTAVLAVFTIVGIGAAARRANWLTEEADATLLKLVIRAFLPALILATILGDERLRHPANVVIPPIVGLSTVLAGFGLCWLIARFGQSVLGLHTGPQRRTFALCTGLYNYGYIPLPLAAALFDQSTVGVLFVHNVGVEIGIWTVGVMLVSGELGKRWWLRLINPPIIAIAIALTMNFMHLDAAVPAFATKAIAMLGQCAIPVALLLIGATIADHIKQTRLVSSGRVITTSALLRLGLLPAGFLALAATLPVSPELKRVIVLEAAMPSAVFPIILARHYGGDVPTAMRIVLGTSLISLITMPLWLAAGLRVLGMHG